MEFDGTEYNTWKIEPSYTTKSIDPKYIRLRYLNNGWTIIYDEPDLNINDELDQLFEEEF